MKKALFVFLLAVLLCAGTVFAGDVSLSGEFEYGAMTNGDDFAGNFDKIELDLSAAIDDYNTFSMEIEDQVKGNDIGNQSIGITYAEVATDWGLLFSLPVGVVTTIGYDGFSYGDEIGVTGWGLESFGGQGLSTEAAGKVDLSFNGLVSVMAAVNFDPKVGSTDEYEMLFGAALTLEPVSVYVDYLTQDGGSLGAEAKFSTAVADGIDLSVAGSVYYDLDFTAAEELAGDHETVYGLGASVAAFGASLGVSMNGNDADALNLLGVDLNYAFTEMLCADVATIFDLSDAAADTFQGIDLSATYTAGAVGYTLGYLYSDGNGSTANYNSEAALADGGIYMAVRLDF